MTKAFPVHGVGGLLGTLLTGVFVSAAFGGAGEAETEGLDTVLHNEKGYNL